MTTTSNTQQPDWISLMRELRGRAGIYRQPINGTFELTERCNLACGMCYVCQSARDTMRKAKELSPDEWLNLACQAKDNGMVFLLLTGGEVLLRPDFFEIYTPLTRMGFIISLFTNGTMITKTIASRLAEAPPNRTEITIYGATAATYEKVTGVRGSYARFCSGIEELVKRGIPLGLKTIITQQNLDELQAIRQMAKNWGLPIAAGWLLIKRRDCTPSDIATYRLSAAQCIALEAPPYSAALKQNNEIPHEISKPNEDDLNCPAGKVSFSINPYGEMNPCLELTKPAVRPLEIGFHSAWEQVQHYIDSAPSASTCLTCNARNYCPRCIAWSMLETGTFSEPVPYLCEIANERKNRYE